MASITERLIALKPFLGEKGMQDLAEAVREYRTAYGGKWLAEFKANMPHIADMMDLIANHEFNEAWVLFEEQIEEWIETEDSPFKRIGLRTTANVFLPGAKPDIERLHRIVRAEIDRPRA